MSGKDHAGGADAALGTAFREEALLDGVQLFADGQAFDGGDPRAFGLQDGDEAGVDEVAVHQDGAGAALAFAAALLCSSEMEVFAEDVEEALHRWSVNGFCVAVNGASDGGHAVTSLKMGPAMVGSRDSAPALGRLVMRSKISSGSRGISVKAMLVACSMALRIAGAGPSIGSSPMPFAPKAPWGLGISSKVTWMGGTSALVGMM